RSRRTVQKIGNEGAEITLSFLCRTILLVALVLGSSAGYAKTKKSVSKKSRTAKQIVEVQKPKENKIPPPEPQVPLFILASLGIVISEQVGILSGVGIDTALLGSKKWSWGLDLNFSLLSQGYLFAPLLVTRYQILGNQYGEPGATLGIFLGPSFSGGTPHFSPTSLAVGAEGAWHQKVAEFVLFKLLARPLWVDKKLVFQGGISLAFLFK
ncbi:MAG: hypothetical protein EBZ49_15980, partial [Proteobacteria bacterium]|nr:hypothetical protein [Pseudomonadota bacterium]